MLTSMECNLRPLPKGKYEELCLQEELKWKQKSRVQWLRAGDANTKFFHLRATYRRNRNHISHLSDGTKLHTSPESIANHFSFYRNQLGVELPPHTDINFASLYGDESFDLSGLLSPFNIEEVKSVIFSSAPKKAPG